MTKSYSIPLFLISIFLGTTSVVHAQIAPPPSAGQMTSESTMGGTNEDMTVTAPSDAPPPTANDGDVTNDATPPATVDNGEPIKRSDGTVDSSEVEKENPERDITAGAPNYGNSLASGTVQADLRQDLDAQEATDLLNQPSRTVTLSNGVVIGQPAIVAPSTAPAPTVAVPATGGAMGTTSGSASGGAMGGSTAGGSVGASIGGGAFGK